MQAGRLADRYPHCADDRKYKKIEKIGQGTFGTVYKARHAVTNELVAMKKVLVSQEDEGFPITTLREIKILQGLKHENTVQLLEISIAKENPERLSGTTFHLVFEFCQHDLAGLLGNKSVSFTLGNIKNMAQQILNGVFYLHSNNILHRDLKAANVLITQEGLLKVADFGLARVGSKHQLTFTNRVITLWYRPPELLLGERIYGPSVDMWGMGCLLAELWTRNPILKGNSEPRQLSLIIETCGSITPEVWPGVEKLKLFSSMELPKNKPRRVKEKLKGVVKDERAIDIIDKLLTMDPKTRPTAANILDDDFFFIDPLPEDLSNVMKTLSKSNFEYNTRRAPMQERPQPEVARQAEIANQVEVAKKALGFAKEQLFEPIF